MIFRLMDACPAESSLIIKDNATLSSFVKVRDL